MTIDSQELELLGRIESLEMRSLEWGFTGGAVSESEALEMLSSRSAAEESLERLVEARLIFEHLETSGQVRYRSRFAEALRLLVANRQLFPGRPWQGAPRLVADFRIDRRSRRFPARNLAPIDFAKKHGGEFAASPVRRAVWQALTGRPGMLLAGFQERAVLRLANRLDDHGTIVTAGTGSGKTMAFYLPALLAVGEAIDQSHWVKTIAIYPRIELLKDQFAEAFQMARAIDAALSAHGRRPLRIGALFAATPAAGQADELERRGWKRRGRDWVCPWMRCPDCDSDLLWRQSDLDEGQERLRCSGVGCRTEIDDRHLALTRKRIQSAPPDILFTTTEILNQRLSDTWTRTIFGVGSGRKPFLALLDEVHTYEGTSGAQAALTLRRWRHLLGAPLSWVGLSATLDDAARFFADLVGVAPERVVEITPTAEELEERGTEYQMLLRGNPASRASLLSTTIQTAMLLPRVLDPPAAPASGGAFGRRAFLFTDDLDVTNRLFDDLRDAEAYTIFGRPDQDRQPLAMLRAAGDDDRARNIEGQRWRLCEDIGHPLQRRLIVGRTTSQDGGVAPDTNIIVATAALEVGFNDPEVGAVIQHKAPRSVASFLQRKGRAGRDRAMRPITITVLSDYGRDRAVYQSYERMFDPEIEPQHLPIGNPYVLRMQATYALFDWLANETSGHERGWAWDYLSRPIDRPSPQLSTLLGRIKQRLGSLVQGDEATVARLKAHLMGALRVEEDVALSLMWEAPRPLLLEAVPTLVRRLFTRWRLAFPAEATSDLMEDYHPLPDFVPRNLFSDLSLPEVRVLVPPATVNHEWRTEPMPIAQALNQFVPGRVTRRFAFERGGLAHWVPVDPTNATQVIPIATYAEEHEYVGEFEGHFNGGFDGKAIPVYRPWTVRLSAVKRSEALPSSNARFEWRTDVVANGDPLSVPVAPRSPWRPFVSQVDFFLHRFRASAGVRRFAPGARANVRTLADEFQVAVSFEDATRRTAALGFEIEVDGVRLELRLSDQGELDPTALGPALLRDCRFAYLRDRFRRDPELPADLNPFQRDWLFELLAALIAGRSIAAEGEPDGDDPLADERIAASFREVAEEYFGAPAPSSDDGAGEDMGSDDEEDGVGSGAPPVGRHSASRLQQALDFHVARPEVQARLQAISSEFAEPDQPTFREWLRRVVVETTGEAMLQACIASAPRHATTDNLLLDIRDGGEVATIWITEMTLGGAGVLQAFAERFSGEPQLFFNAVEAALAPTDLEMVDEGIRRVLGLARDEEPVAAALARLRATDSHLERARLWRDFSREIGGRGGADLSHALVVALNSRLLRSGSGPELDALLLDLVGAWDALESRGGVAVGLREYAYAVGRDAGLVSRVRRYLRTVMPVSATDRIGIMAAVTSLLWARGPEIRRTSLQSYHPYREPRSTDPALVRRLLLPRAASEVDSGDPDWRDRLNRVLATDGTCRLSAPVGELPHLRAALVSLCVSPVAVGVLQFYPAVDRIERAEGRVVAELTLREHA